MSTNRWKLVLVVAPAGYGKTTVATALASEVPESVVFDDVRSSVDLDDALQRLAAGGAAARAVVCSRRPLVAPLAFALPHETRLIRAGELRFGAERIDELFAPLGASEAQIEALEALTLGWPVAVLAAHSRAAQRDTATAIGDLTSPDRSIDNYISNEVLPSLSGDARSLLLIAGYEPLSAGDADLLLGARSEAALDEVEGSFLLRRPDGAYHLHPLLRAVIERRFQPAARDAAVSLAKALERARLPMRSARWYLRAGDSAAASAAYSQLTFARMSGLSTEDAMAAASLDEPALIENLAIFNVAAIEQLYLRDYDRWFVLAEQALLLAPAELPSEIRSVAVLALVTRYAYFGRYDDARRILNDQVALVGENPAYRPVFALCDAFVRASHDEYVDIAALRGLLGPMLLDPYCRAAFASVASYVYTTQGDWPALRCEIEVMAEIMERSKQEMHAAEVLMSYVFFSWLYGDAERFRNALERLECVHRESGSSFFIRCVRGEAATATEEYETPQVRAYGYLIASALEGEAGKARWYARRALQEAQRAGRRFLCVLAHLALRLLAADDAEAHIEKARCLAEAIGSPALLRAAGAVAGDAGDAGMLDEYRARFVRPRCGEGLLTINVLSSTLEWEGKALALKERPRQIVFAIALGGAPLRGDELAGRVWPDRDPARMRNALRVHIATIRKASDPKAIIFENGRYRIGVSHVVDLVAANEIVRQAARNAALGQAMRQSLEEIAAGFGRRADGWEHLDWFVSVQRRTETLRRSALLALAEDALYRHDAAATLSWTSLLIESDPCDDRARSIAIRAHLQADDQAEAMREYRDYRRAVRRDLGVDLVDDRDADEVLRAFAERGQAHAGPGRKTFPLMGSR